MKRFIGFVFKLILTVIILALIAPFIYIWFTPPRTSYMLQGGEPVAYQFVSIDHISRFALASAIAHEDQQLGTRSGAFDLEDFQARAKAHLEGKPDPLGSTIPQQLVKNIFLWPQGSGYSRRIGIRVPRISGVLWGWGLLIPPPERYNLCK
jgi:monofunctional biosynthetic peptidoglycan transglycosylase